MAPNSDPLFVTRELGSTLPERSQISTCANFEKETVELKLQLA